MSPLQITAIALIAAHLAVSYLPIKQKKKPVRYALSGLFYATAVLLLILYRPSFRLTEIVYIPFGAAVGYLSYVASLFIVNDKVSPRMLINLKWRQLDPRFKKKMNKEMLRNIFTSSGEEAVYRCGIQYMLSEINVFIAIIVTSVAFAAAHRNRKRALVQLIDLFVFSVIVGACLYFTRSFLFAAIIHITRNVFVIMDNYGKTYDDLKNARRSQNIARMVNQIKADRQRATAGGSADTEVNRPV